MKNTNHQIYFALCIVFCCLVACTKESIEKPKPLSSITVVNAAINIPNVKVYAAQDYIPWKVIPTSDVVAFGKSAMFSAWAGPNVIMAASSSDTTVSLYSNTKTEEFNENGYNTLFLSGTTGSYEGALLTNDNIEVHEDSVIGIRFINLSPNSKPVNITLSTSPLVNEATGLSYRQITGFKKYPAGAAITSMVFQIRDANGVLLSSYTLPATPVSAYNTVSVPYARFRNITLAIKGLQGTTSGVNIFGLFPVPHY